MAIIHSAKPPDLDIRDPRPPHRTFISYDVSHPFTEDPEYLKVVRKFFEGDVVVGGESL